MKSKDTIIKSDASFLECPGYGGPCPSDSKIATTCIDPENSKSFVCRLCNDDDRNKAFYNSQKVHSKYDQIVDNYIDTSIKYEQSVGNSPLNPVVHHDNLFTIEIDDISGRRITYVNVTQKDIETLNASNRSTAAHLRDNHIDFANILMWKQLTGEYRNDIFIYPTLDFFNYILNDRIRECRDNNKTKQSIWVKVWQERKLLLFPCCLSNHYSLMVIIPDPAGGGLYHLDSIPGYHTSSIFFAKFRNYMERLYAVSAFDTPTFHEHVISVTEQKNTIDCGLHVIHNISIVVQNYINEMQVLKYKQYIIKIIT